MSAAANQDFALVDSEDGPVAPPPPARSRPGRLVYVAHDRLFAVTLVESLRNEGHDVLQAASVADARALLPESTAQLVLLDQDGLSGDDIVDLLAHARRANLPAIAFASSDDPINRIIALEAGADDCIVKPFHLRELSIRIRRLLGRASTCNTAPRVVTGATGLVLGIGRFDPVRHEILSPGAEPIFVTPRESKLLLALLKAKGAVVPRERLSDRLIADSDSAPRDVDVALSRLRKKLRFARLGIEIVAVTSIGYCLNDPLRSRRCGPALREQGVASAHAHQQSD